MKKENTLNLIMRADVRDFSPFFGYAYNLDNNKSIDETIDIFLKTNSYKYLQIESTYNDLHIHQIAYISNKLPDCNMFIKTEFDDDNLRDNKYKLCFVKK